MKNIRKIVAILAAVLMLCSVLPMSALSVVAAEAPIYKADFENGTLGGWQNDAGGMSVVSSSELPVANAACGDYVVKKDKPAGDWGFLEDRAGFNVEPNTDYVVTVDVLHTANQAYPFQAYVSKGTWINDIVGTTGEVKLPSSQWNTLSFTFNSGENTQLFTSIKSTWDNVTYYFDNFTIAKVDPYRDMVVNGGFETGNIDGWNKHQTVNVEADAAHDGNYGAHLQDNGTWGGILDQTVAVEAGQTYEVSFWIKVNKFGINLQIKDGDKDGASLASGTWYDFNNHSNWTEKTYVVTPTTNAIFFNFCGGGNGTPDPNKETDTYIDSFSVKKVKTASSDGYITNGDFELGELNFPTGQGSNPGVWYNLWTGTTHELVAGYNSDYALKGTATGAYSITYQNVAVEPNTDYVVTAWAKDADNSALWIKNAGGNGDIKTKAFAAGSDWQLNTITFNSGANTTVWVGLMGIAAGATYTVDNVTMAKAEQPEATVIWSIDFNDGDKKFNVGEVVAEGPDGSNCYKWDFGGGYSSNYASGLSMDSTKDYNITMKVKGSINSAMAITLMPGSWATWWNGPSFNVTTEWQEVVLNIPANSVVGKDGAPFNTGVFEFQGTDGLPAYTLYVDDIVISEGLAELPEQPEQPEEPEEPEQPVYGEFTNGDFETGTLDSWSTKDGHGIASIVEGHNGGSAMQIANAGKWAHIRQEDIAVDPDSTYRLTAYVKGAQNMAFVIKTANDLADMTSHDDCIFPAGDEWQKVTLEFKTDGEGVVYKEGGQPYDKVINGIDILVIAYEADGAVIIDDITLEKVVPCEHEYDDCDDADCNLCGEIREPSHELTYVAAVVPANCQETGHNEYWKCTECGAYFGNAEGSYQLNPEWVNYTGEHVRPANAAACAVVACELCGEDSYGTAQCDRGDAPACQTTNCINCGGEILGEGHSYGINEETGESLSPLCQPGDCIYCNEHLEFVYEHEKDTAFPCLDGKCIYGCGLEYPATEDHVDEDDTTDFCDTCWSHLACIDADNDGFCDGCYTEMPSDPAEDILYGDANGDGEISTMDVVMLQQYVAGNAVDGLNEANADANGDGEISTLDVVLLQQFVAGNDVTLGPK